MVRLSGTLPSDRRGSARRSHRGRGFSLTFRGDGLAPQDERPTGERAERRESAPVLRHSHPRKKELAARAPVRQARILESVLDDPETPHNEARGCECPSMHLGARAYRRDFDPAFVPVVVVAVDFSPVPWGNGGGGEWARRGRSTGRAVRFFASRGVRARAHYPRAFSACLSLGD